MLMSLLSYIHEHSDYYTYKYGIKICGRVALH